MSRPSEPPEAPAAVSPAPPISRGEALALGGVCALALALRTANLQQLHAHDPFFALPSVDARLYHEWARAIAAGDWLGREAFLNSPAYAYGLAAVYALVGPSLLVAKGLQALGGTLACALTWAVGRRVFAPGVAVGGAAVLAVSQMPIFYEGTLVPANALVPLGLLAVLGVLRALERPGGLRWLAAGAAVGLAALVRPNLLLFGALCGAWLPLALRRHPGRRRVAWLAAFAAGAALLVAPATLHNYAASRDFVPITYAGGLNLLFGNNPDADGTFRVPRFFPRSAMDDPWEQRAVYRSVAERAEGRALRPSEISAVWTREALRFAREATGPWLRLMGRKAALSVNAFEPWNIRSLTITREFSWVLRLPLLEFGVLVPFAFLGVWLTAGRWRALAPLYALLATVFGTMLVFFVLSRYRVPAIPVLALFAVAGVVEVARRARRPGAVRRLAFPLLATAGFAVFTHQTLATEDLSIAWYNLGNRYKALGDWPRAEQSYGRALRGQPGYLSAHNNLALVHEAWGRDDLARAGWERVRALAVERGLERYVERADRHLRGLAERAAPATPGDAKAPADGPAPRRPDSPVP